VAHALSRRTSLKTAVGDAAKMIYDAIAKAQWGAQ